MIGSMNAEEPSVTDPFARAAASAAVLRERAGVEAFDAAVVLGSGWRDAADAIGVPEAEVPLADLGGFPAPGVKGHAASVRYVRSGQRKVLVYLGRVHMYEGHDPHTVVHGVRTAIAAGCRTVVLTNAAGGINAGYAVGEPVLISDHLNLTGRSPLTGTLPSQVPSRFTDLTDAYSSILISAGVSKCGPGSPAYTPSASDGSSSRARARSRLE